MAPAVLVALVFLVNLSPHEALVVRCGDGADCTVLLQAALDSRSSHILVESYKIAFLGPIRTNASNVVLEFTPGAVFSGFLNHSASYSPALSPFQIYGSSNFSIIGNGVVFQKVTFKVGAAARDVFIAGIFVTNPGWDGLYVRGVTGLTIKDTVFDRPYRNGVSVIDAEDMFVDNCTFSNSLPNGTGTVSPMAGVDLEPNRFTDRLINITFRRCKAINNSGAGFQVFPANLNSSSSPMSISFNDCLVEGVGIKPLMFPTVPDGFYFNAWGGHGVRGSVHVLRGEVRQTASFGAAVYAHGSNDARVIFENTTFDHVAVRSAPFADNHTNSPLVLAWLGSSLEGHPLGGVEWKGVEVIDDLKRPVLFIDGKGSRRLDGISGHIYVHSPYTEACDVAVVPESASSPVKQNITMDCKMTEFLV